MSTMTQPTCCPHCSGTSGYRYTMTESHAMAGAWGQRAESGECGLNVKVSMASCLDCGARCRVQTAEGPNSAMTQPDGTIQ